MKKRIIALVAILALGLGISGETLAKPQGKKSRAIQSYVYNSSNGMQLCKKLNGKTKITVCVGGETEDDKVLLPKHVMAASLKDLAFKFKLNSKTLKARERVLVNNVIDESDCPGSLNADDVTAASSESTELKLCRHMGSNTTICISGAMQGNSISKKQSHWATQVAHKLQELYSRKTETLSAISVEDESPDYEELCEYQEGIFLASNKSYEASKKSVAKAKQDLKAISSEEQYCQDNFGMSCAEYDDMMNGGTTTETTTDCTDPNSADFDADYCGYSCDSTHSMYDPTRIECGGTGITTEVSTETMPNCTDPNSADFDADYCGYSCDSTHSMYDPTREECN